MNLLKSIDLNLGKELRDKDFRDAFFEEWSNDEVADQIRHMRKLRKLRQVDVAKETGMLQSAVSRIEQSKYSSWSFPTLLRIAQALDARVKVVFEPAEDVIRQHENEEKEVQQGISVVNARQAEADEARSRLVEVHGAQLTTQSTRREDVVPTPHFSLLHRSAGLGR